MRPERSVARAASRVPRAALAVCLALAGLAAGAPSAAAATVELQALGTTIGVGGQTRVEVHVTGLPGEGLAAFQLDIAFDPAVVSVLDPNAAAAPPPFAPLGDDPQCATIRGLPTCPDPVWQLTETGRSPLGVGTIDGVAGTVRIAFATYGGGAPSNGDGVVAVLDVEGVAGGTTDLVLSGVTLADASEPPASLPTTLQDVTLTVPEPAPSLVLASGFLLLRSLAARRRAATGRGPRSLRPAPSTEADS